MIKAKVNKHSVNELGHEIMTMEITFPRFILAELNTHRMFSKNSASSRAIPFKKMLKSVQKNPFIPIAWQKNHKGMQGTEYLSKTEKYDLNTFISNLIDLFKDVKSIENKDSLKKNIDEKIDLYNNILKPYSYEEKTLDEWWLFARDKAIEASCILYTFDVTKQLCNRLLEPFMWHTVLITATEWENFFYLRCPQYKIYYENMLLNFRSKKDLLKYVKKVESPEFKNQYDNLTELDWFQVNKGQAEIHMMALAESMWDAYTESKPQQLKSGEWHLPFSDNIDCEKLMEIINNTHETNKGPLNNFLEDKNIYEAIKEMGLLKICTAKCAQTSYTVVGEDDKESSYEDLIKLHDRLVISGHWSPFEHCAVALSKNDYPRYIRVNKDYICGFSSIEGFEYSHLFIQDKDLGWCGNFRGFGQYRKTFMIENKMKLI